VHVPPLAAGTAVPLLLAFHGSSSSGEELEARTGFDQLADQSGFVVAYPEGVDDGSDDSSRSWNAGQCCPSASSIGVDDVSFVAALVEQLERTMPIDRRRVYVTGHSNGAMMAQRLGCERADLFAAVASVAGTLGISRCAPSVTLSIIEIHGTNDANVNFGSAMSALAQWRGADGCGTTADVSTAGSVTTSRWQCAHGSDVESIEIAGAQHPWPGARTPAPNGQVTSTAIDATSAVWAFLSQHSRAG
jgi:polyhydroxybutyrate depolymerase